MWQFEIEYRPGKLNSFADAVSRNPNKYAEVSASTSLVHQNDIEEESLVAGIFDDLEKFFAVTLKRVKAESICDKEIM